MIRLMNMNAVFLAVTVTAAFANYHVKYETQQKAMTVARLETEIAKESEQLRVLDAEWSHLNEPQRLQALAERHLDLHRIAAQQVVPEADLQARFQLAATQDVPALPRGAVVPVAAQLPVDDR